MRQKEVNCILILIYVLFFYQCSKKYNDICIKTLSKEAKTDCISTLNINCFPSKEIPLPYLSFTISSNAKCYDNTSNTKYYLIHKDKKFELSNRSGDGYKMYLINDLPNLYSEIVLEKKNRSGEEFLFVKENDLEDFFQTFSKESYILSENNCKIYFSINSKIKIHYDDIFWHSPN